MNYLVIKKGQKAFSLVELMVAMVIGLFLLSGIASSYISSKKSSVHRDQVSLLEDNGRLALEVITRSLEHVGYSPVSGVFLENPFIENLADVVAETCPDGSVNVVNTGIFRVAADDDALVQDTIGVMYYGSDDVFTDCAGNTMDAVVPVGCRLPDSPLTEAAKIYNSFFINNADNTLMCSGSRSPAPVVIADGVENIQFLYGIENNDDGAVDRYVNATDINADAADNLDWAAVVNVQVAILVRSLKPVKNVAESESFTLLDTVVVAPNDRFQRAVFSTTVHLHNRL